MPEEQVKIKNVDDLYYYYELLDKLEVDEQSIEIALEDFIEDFDLDTSYSDSLNRLEGHVDVDIANAIIKFQDFINNTYKVIKYQDQDITLSEDELKSIKLYIKVEAGSSKLKYIKAVGKIFKELTKDMSAKEKILIITLVTGIVSAAATTAYVSSKYIESEERIALSQEETRKQNNIINGFSKMNSQIDNNIIYRTIEKEGKKAILEPVKQNNSVTYSVESTDSSISDIIDNEKAKKILKNTRSTSVSEILEGQFKISGISDSKEQGKVIIQISTIDSILNGNVKIKKDAENIDYIKLVNCYRDELPIDLIVKTKTLHGKTTIDKIVATVGEITN